MQFIVYCTCDIFQSTLATEKATFLGIQYLEAAFCTAVTSDNNHKHYWALSCNPYVLLILHSRLQKPKEKLNHAYCIVE